MEETRSSAFSSEVVDLPGKYKVMVQPCPPSLDPLAVHAMGANGYSLFSIPRADGQLCTLVAWSSAELPPVLQLPDAELGAAIAADLPKYGEPSQAALSQLRMQQPSKATTVRCSRYDDQPGHALLIGDAAHSTGGTLGQGANSALLDVLALDRLLERRAAADEQPVSIVQAVGAAFSAQQQPEGLALWQLLQLPPRGPLRLPYLAIQTARRVLAGLTRSLPAAVRVAPPVQSLLSESTMPFTEIVARNRAWVDAALASAPSGFAVAPFNDDAHQPPPAV